MRTLRLLVPTLCVVVAIAAYVALTYGNGHLRPFYWITLYGALPFGLWFGYLFRKKDISGNLVARYVITGLTVGLSKMVGVAAVFALATSLRHALQYWDIIFLRECLFGAALFSFGAVFASSFPDLLRWATNQKTTDKNVLTAILGFIGSTASLVISIWLGQKLGIPLSELMKS